ncbi:ATP-dependent DNA helicase 2 subunit KU70 [Zea mays]|uniref:ATP-dependent DNA helicase 2 subunit KU70 n=1 Tax=Zea mays TaxID=4577 RepID=A0A3L6GD83_MAIZE|nr:ATP-dependent DNA helicase 2 subunit KU70 [Zea mays]
MPREGDEGRPHESPPGKPPGIIVRRDPVAREGEEGRPRESLSGKPPVRKLTGVFDLLKIMLYKVCANGSSALPDWEMEASIMEFYGRIEALYSLFLFADTFLGKGIFRDDRDEDEDSVQEREVNKEMVVYLVDASPKMFTPATTQVSMFYVSIEKLRTVKLHH